MNGNQFTKYLKLIKSPLHNEVHAARTHETETISISETTTPNNKFNKIGHRHLQYVMLLVTSCLITGGSIWSSHLSLVH